MPPDVDFEHTVLLGSAGTGAAFGLATSLVGNWGPIVRIVTADINPPHLVATTTLAAHSVQSPRFDDPRFVPHLRSLLDEHKIDTYFPILDEEILLAGELNAAGLLEGVQFFMAPPAETTRRCFDKFECAVWFEEAGLPCPTAVLVDAAIGPPAFPCFIKPRHGRGSQGVFWAHSFEDWERALLAPEGTLIAQEACEGPELTIDTFVDRTRGLIRAIARERLEVKSGVCTKARVFEDQSITELASSIAGLLDFDGIFCFQLMRSQFQPRWVITDVNPRPGAGTRMTVAAGIDMLAAVFAARWGEDPTPHLPYLRGERFVTRQYMEFVQ